MPDFLICSDLDRTILPNGSQPESKEARPLLRCLAARPEVCLVYVSGRSRQLLQQAIADYDIPVPDYAVGDVGTTIYEPTRNWQHVSDWEREISRGWHPYHHGDLVDFLSDLAMLTIQEPEKQSQFKLSYYTDPEVDDTSLREEVLRRLSDKGVRASVIFSIDEKAEKGLVDILPENATKLEAIRFIQQKHRFPDRQMVFGGDSGNDLTVLTSGIQSVLVRNASENVRRTAVEIMTRKELQGKLYLARGQFMGMNGNYSAGLLEGIVHFIPAAIEWLAHDS